MSGKSSTRGPVPKRSTERRRRNKTSEDGASTEVDQVILDPGEFPPFTPPEPNPNWHPAARAMWDSACQSGQRIFWEPSDWAILGLTCSQISQEYANDLILEKVKEPMEAGSGGGERLVYGSRPMPAGKFAAILKALGSLGMSESDRRRLHMELTRGQGPEEGVTAEDIQRAQLELIQGGGQGA